MEFMYHDQGYEVDDMDLDTIFFLLVAAPANISYHFNLDHALATETTWQQ